MKKLVIILALAVAVAAGWSSLSSLSAPEVAPEIQQSIFEKAVALIKKYETLHQPRHWPLVGYGHLVMAGEKFSRTKALSEKEADALLRKDLLKNCAQFRQYGADSLLLGVLAYNIGSGNVKKSSVVKKLAAGDRDIYNEFVAHSRYRGRQHAGLKKRRIEEFENIFLTDSLIRQLERDLAPAAAPDSASAAPVVSDNKPSNPDNNEH